MKGSLFLSLMQFALAKQTARERFKYVLLGMAFYPFLSRDNSARAKGGDDSTSSQAGDDIYPLF